jgi:hypothetical protein
MKSYESQIIILKSGHFEPNWIMLFYSRFIFAMF